MMESSTMSNENLIGSERFYIKKSIVNQKQTDALCILENGFDFEERFKKLPSPATPFKKNDQVYYSPHTLKMFYPKSIQKQVCKMPADINKVLNHLTVPEERFVEYNLKLQDQLSERQNNTFKYLCDNFKQLQNNLSKEEAWVSLQLRKKRIDVENPDLDVQSVFNFQKKKKVFRKKRKYM